MQSTIEQAATAAPIAAPGDVFDPAGGRPSHKIPLPFDQASPTLITLQVKAVAAAFENFPENADNAGLTNGRSYHCLGLVSRDTSEHIATVHYNNWDYIEHRLTMVEIRIDPETCEVELEAGTRLIVTLERLAKQLNAVICDGMGSPLDSEARNALAKHIDTTIRRRYLAMREMLTVQLPDGSSRWPGRVSFENFTLQKQPGKARSRIAARNSFDVPELRYEAARAHACRMVGELKKVFALHRVERPAFTSMLSDALGVALPNNLCDGKSRRENVAGAFLDILNGVFANGLANTSATWLAQEAAMWEEFAADVVEQERTNRSEFVERMRAAKAAKKARAEGGAA